VYVSVSCDPEWGHEQPGAIVVGSSGRARAECCIVSRRQWTVEFRNLDDDRDSELLFSAGYDDGANDYVQR
jgi:hypothetical protein